MEYVSVFRFLNFKEVKRKDGDGFFLQLNLVDENMSPCSFFVFDMNLINKIKKFSLSNFQKLNVKFSLTYSMNNWRVNFLDVNV